MIEKIKEIGRKSFKFALKVIAAFFIYCFGAITGPKSWDLSKFIENIAYDPRWTIPMVSLIVGIVLFLSVVFIVKIFLKE